MNLGLHKDLSCQVLRSLCFSLRLYSFGGPQFPAPGETELVSAMVPIVLIAVEIDLGGGFHMRC